MKCMLKRLSHPANCSAITAAIDEKMKPGFQEYYLMNVWNAVKWLFVMN